MGAGFATRPLYKKPGKKKITVIDGRCALPFRSEWTLHELMLRACISAYISSSSVRVYIVRWLCPYIPCIPTGLMSTFHHTYNSNKIMLLGEIGYFPRRLARRSCRHNYASNACSSKPSLPPTSSKEFIPSALSCNRLILGYPLFIWLLQPCASGVLLTDPFYNFQKGMTLFKLDILRPRFIQVLQPAHHLSIEHTLLWYSCNSCFQI